MAKDSSKTPRKPNFISTRFSPSVATPNPRPLKYYQMQTDEDGNSKFVESTPVAPSMAADFSIEQNQLLNRTGSPQYRVNIDITEVEENLTKLM